MLSRFLVLLLATGLLFSCRATKKINTAINKTDSTSFTPVIHHDIDSAALRAQFYSKVMGNQVDFNTFSSKVKVDFSDNTGKKNNATAFIRIQKDSLIWISLTGPLGVEGYRILMSPDSVLVMNKLEKAIARRSVSFLQEIIKLPLDFYTTQDMIVGNPVFFTRNITSLRTVGNEILILSVGDFFRHLITLDTATQRINHSKLDDVDGLRNRTCAITFSGYTTNNGRQFSENRNIVVAEKSKLDIALDFKQVEFDIPLTFPFTIPRNYSIEK